MRDASAVPSAKAGWPADYYPSLRKAVASLEPTAAGRADFYARVRETLSNQLASADPPFSSQRVAAEQAALEDALDRIEAEYERPSRRTAPEHGPAMAEAPPRAKVSSGGSAAPHLDAMGARRYFPTGILLALIAIAFALAVAAAIFGARDAEQGVKWVMSVMTLIGYPILIVLGVRAVFTTVWRTKRLKKAGLRPHGVMEPARRRAAEDPDWSSPATDLTVPCAVERPVSPSRYAKLTKWRRIALIPFRLAVVAGLLLFPLAVASDVGWGTRMERLRDIELSAVMQLIAVIGLALVIIASFLAFSFRNRAVRVLLLRPFGERRMTRALRRFVRRNLGTAGYVFTLSDRNYKPGFVDSLVFRLISGGAETLVMLVVGSFFESSKRIGSVKTEIRFWRLAKALMKLQNLAFLSFISRGQAFNIRSTDAWWQMCIRMLMHSCEIVVVDLSKVKEGTAWELDELQRRAFIDKCIFVAHEAEQAHVTEVLARHFRPADRPFVHFYRGDGRLAEAEPFAAQLDESVKTALTGWARQLAKPKLLAA